MQKRSSFSSRIGFVLAAAGSAIGLGNIWRFPYLAAQYGGGSFLIIYLAAAVTFGFSLMVAEIGLGRKTRQSAIRAYRTLSKGFTFEGILTAAVPMIIFPYYVIINGWVIKYFAAFLIGQDKAAAEDGFFGAFISKPVEPLVWFLICLVLCTAVILAGVVRGIEKISKILMPVLLVLMIVLSVYICFQPGAGAGIRYYFVPSLEHLSVKTFLAAISQLFYSLSLAMGIMITYGSYMNREDSLEGSVRQIEVFDTLVAVLAGLMIIPSVFAFSGGDATALTAGPSLMFVTLPKAFATMVGYVRHPAQGFCHHGRRPLHRGRLLPHGYGGGSDLFDFFDGGCGLHLHGCLPYGAAPGHPDYSRLFPGSRKPCIPGLRAAFRCEDSRHADSRLHGLYF